MQKLEIIKSLPFLPEGHRFLITRPCSMQELEVVQVPPPPTSTPDYNVAIMFMNHSLFLSGFKVCSFREGSCEVHYTVSTDLSGDEDTFHIVMDEGQSSVSILRQGNSNCIPRQEIWPIFVGIILGIIVVGLLAVILWRCCTYIGVSLARKD